MKFNLKKLSYSNENARLRDDLRGFDLSEYRDDIRDFLNEYYNVEEYEMEEKIDDFIQGSGEKEIIEFKSFLENNRTLDFNNEYATYKKYLKPQWLVHFTERVEKAPLL